MYGDQDVQGDTGCEYCWKGSDTNLTRFLITSTGVPQQVLLCDKCLDDLKDFGIILPQGEKT